MTILSESTKNVATSVGSGLIIIGLIAFITAIILLTHDSYISSVVAFTIAVIFYIVASISSFVEPHRRIKAILSDDYPAVELLDKYTVDGNEGKVWTLTEREPMKKQENE